MRRQTHTLSKACASTPHAHSNTKVGQFQTVIGNRVDSYRHVHTVKVTVTGFFKLLICPTMFCLTLSVTVTNMQWSQAGKSAGIWQKQDEGSGILGSCLCAYPVTVLPVEIWVCSTPDTPVRKESKFRLNLQLFRSAFASGWQTNLP